MTLTVPEELRGLLRACPREGYDAIFAAGSETIQDLLKTPKWLGSDNVDFSCMEAEVTFRFTPSGTKSVKTRAVEGWKFV